MYSSADVHGINNSCVYLLSNEQSSIIASVSHHESLIRQEFVQRVLDWMKCTKAEDATFFSGHISFNNHKKCENEQHLSIDWWTHRFDFARKQCQSGF